jgi:hypothetical protein
MAVRRSNAWFQDHHMWSCFDEAFPARNLGKLEALQRCNGAGKGRQSKHSDGSRLSEEGP